MIKTHELQVLNDDHETRPTRFGGSLHGIIDLNLATPGAGPGITSWKVLEEEDQASHSDHVMIVWKWTGLAMGVDPRWTVRGWALKRLDQKKEEELKRRETGGEEKGPALGRPG